MKAQLDENLPPSLARAVNAIASIDGHEVVHVSEYAPRGTPDIQLFSLAGDAGITIHVTQDHHNRRPEERQAIAKAGLSVFVLAKGWGNLSHYDRAARLIEWWPKMMQLAKLTTPGSMFKVPHKRAANGQITPIK